jgi:hypothetical protein
MATTFTNSFTGKGTGILLPSGEGLQRAQEKLSERLIDAEKIKVEAFRKSQEEFLKAQDIDPATSISIAATRAQAEMVDANNKKWGSILSKEKVLSTERKLEQLRDRRVIEAKGDEIRAMQKAWEMEDALVKKNPLDFDEKEHALKTLNFMQNGTFDMNDIPWAAQPVSDELQKLRGKIGVKTSITTPDPLNKGYLKTTAVMGEKKDFAPVIRDLVFKNPKHMKDMLQQWQALPQEQKNQYLDINKDGVVSPQEEQAIKSKDLTNPILNWYVDQNWRAGRFEEDLGKPQRIPQTAAKTGFNWALGIGPNNNRNGEFLERPGVKIQNLPSYTKWYDFQLGSVPTVAPQIGTYKNASTGATGTLDRAVSVKIIGYDAGSDKLVFSLEEDVLPLKGEGREKYMPKGTKIEVDASDYNALLEAKPIGFSREKALGGIGLSPKLAAPVKKKKLY